MSDSMDEMFGDVDRVVRTALTMASQVAESKARQRDAQLREAAQREQEALRNLESAQRAQQEAARMVYGPLTDPRTFRQASVPTIEAGWQAAAAWADRDPRAAAAADAIRWNINERFGSDAAAAATLPQLALDVQVDGVLESAAAREDAARTARAEADWQRIQAGAHEDDARQELTTADRLDVGIKLRDAATIATSPRVEPSGSWNSMVRRSRCACRYTWRRQEPAKSASAPFVLCSMRVS